MRWVRHAHPRPSGDSGNDGIRPKHISHLGFVGDPTGPHGVSWCRVLPEIRAPAVGAREPPALAVAGGDLPLPKPFKRRDLGLETAWNSANAAHTVRCSDRAWSGCWGRSGLSRLIPIIL